MRGIIVFAALLAAASCQIRPSRFPQRHAHFLNAAPTSDVQELEPVRSPPASSPALERRKPDDFEEYDIERNRHAQYQFSTNIEDHINDQTQQREETRDGLNVKGMYSYSDGYYKRTVHYVADENGYRVTGMESVPLDGPQVDLMGTASVSSSAHGHELKYKVVSVPISERESSKF